MAALGRPPLTEADAVAQALRIQEAVLALRNGRTGHLEKMGLTEKQAALLALKRHRGPVGHWLGEDMAAMYPKHNAAARAGQIALDLSLSGATATEAVALAADRAGIDVRHVWRAFKRAKLDEEEASVRRAQMGFSCQELPVTRSD